MRKARKINGHTVRGGWSSTQSYGKINGQRFSILAKDSFITNKGMVTRVVRKIEEGKITLPIPASNSYLYYLMPDKSIVSFK